MSEKQKACINWICETLGIQYDSSDTKQDAWKFINYYMDRAKEAASDNRCCYRNVNFLLGIF